MRASRTLGLGVRALIGLAALALPRAVLLDLHLIEEDGALSWFLALGPVGVWVVAAVLARVPNPFLTLLAVGAVHGTMLVITHQLLWEPAFRGSPPAVGVGPAATLVPRIAAVPSGLFTGAMIGAIGGLLAGGLQSLTGRRPAEPTSGPDGGARRSGPGGVDPGRPRSALPDDRGIPGCGLR